MTLIQPEELASDRPYEPWGSRGCDVWNAITAARCGDAVALRRLVAIDPKLARYGEPLHFAVREGHLEAVSMLLEVGADADAAGRGGETLATVARDRGHDAVARVIDAARARSARVTPADDGAAGHPIHGAADTDDVGAMAKWLDADPALVHRTDRKGATPLHRAVMAASRGVIGLLLDRGADIHARHGAGPGDPASYAPVDFEPIDLALFWHRTTRDSGTVRLLLDRGATYDLTVAAALGDGDHIKARLDGNPDAIRESRPWGFRPLPAAVRSAHDAIVRLLVERGADPTWSEGPEAPRGSALHSAARAGNTAIVELLLDHGADPNAFVNASGNATWAAKTPELRQLLFARGGRLDCYDLVWLGEEDEVVRRVAADPREADAGCGGVFTAAATLGKRDLVVRLLDAGARVPPMVTGCRSYLLENAEILKLLLASGMNPDLPNWQRATPLHDLCGRDGRGCPRANRAEIATLLLEAGADISARDEEYRSTPLAWAARCNIPDMVELLLARGAPTSLPDDEPWATPMAWALKRGHSQIAAMLQSADAARSGGQPQSDPEERAMSSTPTRKIFVNLPVRDLKASRRFFTALGFSFNPQFTDDNAACMIVSDEAFVMLLTEPFFQGFTKRERCDPATHTEALFALSCEKRAEVDDLVSKAIAAGGTHAMDPMDHGFMYVWSFYDLDGHHWEAFWMDPAQAG